MTIWQVSGLKALGRTAIEQKAVAANLKTSSEVQSTKTRLTDHQSKHEELRKLLKMTGLCFKLLKCIWQMFLFRLVRFWHAFGTSGGTCHSFSSKCLKNVNLGHHTPYSSSNIWGVRFTSHVACVLNILNAHELGDRNAGCLVWLVFFFNPWVHIGLSGCFEWPVARTYTLHTVCRFEFLSTWFGAELRGEFYSTGIKVRISLRFHAGRKGWDVDPHEIILDILATLP